LSDGARLVKNLGELVFIEPKYGLQRHGHLEPAITAATLRDPAQGEAINQVGARLEAVEKRLRVGAAWNGNRQAAVLERAGGLPHSV
jgi:hypothetical protein